MHWLGFEPQTHHLSLYKGKKNYLFFGII